jgi:hypothetical protein
MKESFKYILKGLPFRVLAPVVIVTAVVGIGLFFLSSDRFPSLPTVKSGGP